ncbi:hypothetical protein DICVIV_03052 [Dictyocaulus viviparus]|uniref:Uncharacterized protein n=1 Tax=Dictyocaulus viviparus TaxID=29172 RepID=A0A0D8Y1T8_DICVI|nr:hypothetical protein DICVIV_03052 [Dictyocaulus viviparus]
MRVPPPTDRHTPSKGSLSILVTVQLIIAIILLLENSLNLTKNVDHFESDETKSVVFAAWLLIILWLVTIFTSLAALLTNSFNLLLPHLIWTIPLCGICLCCSFTFYLSDTRPWTMILSTGISVLLGVTIFVELRCFFEMRRYLR